MTTNYRVDIIDDLGEQASGELIVSLPPSAPTAPSRIVSRAEILAALGKGSVITDADLALLNMIHLPTEALVEQFIGYKLTLQTYTEYLPARNMLMEMDRLVEGWELVGGRVVPWVRDSGYIDRRILALTHLPVRYPLTSVYEWLDAWSTPGG